ncbi:MAG: glycoside hydrolase family 3 protein [Saprospiraceae bacterium]
MLKKLTNPKSTRKITILSQFSLLILVLFIISCNENSKEDEVIPIDLENQIGQMIMVGFRGLDIKQSEHIVRDVKEYGIGGVVLYSIDLPSQREQPRNIKSPEQFKKLSNDLQALSKTPLWIGIDQEGGRVSRLIPKYGFPPRIPSALYLGKLNNPDSSQHYAAQTANLLQSMGINFNFAPVVDVNVNPDCPVIGGLERSFSDDENIVTQQATIIINENKKQGILSSLKHFPGHGSAKTDSHKGFTDVTDTWTEKELLPYKELIKTNTVDVIMTAHVFNAQLDSLYPATLSKKITHHYLREVYKWDGVIISDDMHMGAIADNFELEIAIEKALEAGVDMLMFSNNSPKAYDPEIAPKAITIIKKLIADGKITEERIQESYNRIMKLK